jgi:hypothetical protein
MWIWNFLFLLFLFFWRLNPVVSHSFTVSSYASLGHFKNSKRHAKGISCLNLQKLSWQLTVGAPTLGGRL